MNTYEKNMGFLSKKFPELVSFLEELGQQSDNIVLTKNNEPNMKISTENKDYFLHSSYNAKQEALRWVNTIDDKVKNSKHIFVIGIGLGYFLEAILDKTNNQYIYVYEPSSEIFSTWVSTRDVISTLSNKNIKIVAFGGIDLLPLIITNQISEQLSGSIEIVAPPIYEKLYSETIQSVEIQMKQRLVQQIANLHTRLEHNKTWLKSILLNANYAATLPSISDLKNVWLDSGVKAIVVGSGPSLKEDVHYLKNLKSTCLVIAAGSSIQALQHYGINPHFVVSMDGSLSNYDVFKSIDTKSVPLIMIPQLYHKIVEEYQGDIFVAKFGNERVINSTFDLENNIPSFSSTGTVTGTAIQIAFFMGVRQIILMGQDLSYPDEQYYAPGVNHIDEEIKESRVKHADQWVDNVEGGKNRTKTSMQVLLNDIEVLVKALKLQGVEVINTSKKGAVISETEWISMEKLAPELLAADHQNFDITQQINTLSLEKKLSNLMLLKNKLSENLIHFKKMDTKLDNLDRQLKKLQKEVKSANRRNVEVSLNQVNKQWKWITNQEIFEVFYNYSLGHYLNIYMRNVPDIVRETDPINKGELIVEHLGSLVQQMISINPTIYSLIEESLQLNYNFIQLHDNTLKKINHTISIKSEEGF